VAKGVKNRDEVKYGPFGDAEKDSSVSIHYQTSDAVLNAEYERKVMVSQWAGMLSFEDRYVFHHDGAKYGVLC
jgi:hypothetical protein